MLQQKKLKMDEGSSTIDPSKECNAIDLNSLLAINEYLDLGSCGLTLTEIPREQTLQDEKDRDVVRRCLERAYEGASKARSSAKFSRRGSNGTDSQQDGLSFLENGRDLIQEAEAALRNPSAQSFLLTVLNNRARFESQRRARSFGEDPMTKERSRSFRTSLD